MKLLALDASSDACGAALWLDGRLLARERVVPRGHAELLLPMVAELLAEGGLELVALDGIAFGRGPGSFTGVRIAVSVAQGLGYGAGLELAAVSDLAALARGAWRRHGARRVLAVLDARMGELYGGAFELDVDGVPTLVGVESVANASSLALPAGGDWFIAGTGFTVQGEVLKSRIGSGFAGGDGALLPAAVDVAALGAIEFAAGRAIAPMAARPVYLRDDVVQRPAAVAPR